MGRFEFVESHGLLLFLALAGFAGVGEDGAVGPLRAVFRYGRAELGYEPSLFQGLVMKSSAPRFMASTASEMSPKAVIRMTAGGRGISFMRASQKRPSRRRGGCCRNSCRAELRRNRRWPVAPAAAAGHRWPLSSRIRCREQA